MGRGTTVPISRVALKWAIKRSGFTLDEFAADLKFDEELLADWLSGDKKPNLTQFNKITKKLRRPAALFFMERPPSDTLPNVSFRAPIDSDRKGPNPTELRFLREASRLQKTASWILSELEHPNVALPRLQVNQNPEVAAGKIRQLLLSTTISRLDSQTTAAPWKIWRERLEEIGVMVLALPLGKSSCRGFSLWDGKAPVVAINTAWNNQARLFSMFHELGHLITRTQSVCVESSDGRFSKAPDKVERWAERFSASVLMPWPEVIRFLGLRLGIAETNKVTDLSVAKKVAGEFDASLRASVIRLIEHDMATWDLYREIPAASDWKQGGGGGQGRVRREKRLDEYGKQTIGVFMNAVDSGLLHRSEALAYLNIADGDFDEVRHAL